MPAVMIQNCYCDCINYKLDLSRAEGEFLRLKVYYQLHTSKIFLSFSGLIFHR